MTQTRKSRAVGAGAAALFAATAALLVAPSMSHAEQFVLFDVTFTYTKDDADNSQPSKSHYYVRDKQLNPDRPKDWTAPVDYRNGTVHVRTEVIEKPAGSEPTTWSLCYIPNKGQKNGYGCTGTVVYREKGVYEQDVSMKSFWQNDSIVWSEGIKQMDLVIKDGSGGSGHAHKRPDHEKFFPTKVRITMVQVSVGSKYDPSLVPNLPTSKEDTGEKPEEGAAPLATAPAEPADMQRLFNGQDLTGWDGDPRLWSVKEGAIRGETTAENPAKGNTFIIWKNGVTKDFDLRLSFQCNATNNSGIQYRSKHIVDGGVPNKWVVRGYQHEVRNEIMLPSVSGFIYDEGGKRGRLCLVGEKAVWEPDGKKTFSANLIDQAGFEKLFKVDDWNDVVILARGNHIQHYLNNRLILDFSDNDPALALREGILALQLHAGKPMWVEFKNIRIKDLK
jgi:hypothetical protein